MRLYNPGREPVTVTLTNGARLTVPGRQSVPVDPTLAGSKSIAEAKRLRSLTVRGVATVEPPVPAMSEPDPAAAPVESPVEPPVEPSSPAAPAQEAPKARGRAVRSPTTPVTE